MLEFNACQFSTQTGSQKYLLEHGGKNTKQIHLKYNRRGRQQDTGAITRAEHGELHSKKLLNKSGSTKLNINSDKKR